MHDFSEERRAFAASLLRLRREHRLSQREMASRLGIGVGSLRRLERGELPPRLSVNVVYAVFRQFGVPPSVQFRPAEKAVAENRKGEQA